MLRLRRFQLEVASCCLEMRIMESYYVYAYVFDDGSTYIGLTRNPKMRDKCHRFRTQRPSSVRKYADKTGADVPDMFILESGLDSTEAQKMEDLYRCSVPKDLQLNIMSTGVGVGSLGFARNPLTPEERHRRELEAAHRRDKKYREQNREAIKEYRRKYNTEHPEKKRAQWDRYFNKNKDSVYAKHAAYYKKNRDKIRDKHRRYHEAHLAEHRMRQAKYEDAHREEIKARRRIRYLAKKILVEQVVKMTKDKEIK